MRKLLLALFILGFATTAHTEVVRQKNVATVIQFNIWKNDGTLLSSAADLDSEIDTWADGANPDGFTDCTNEAQEIGSTGQYYLALTNTEMNADYIAIQVKSSSAGAVVRTVKIRTQVGDPLLLATTDDGGVINVTTGKIDEVSTLTGHTAQTGDAYAIVNNGTYGNSALNTLLTSTGIKVATNADKTGYALTQAFPANFANLSISATTGLVDITQAAADKVWVTTARVLTAGTNIVLAKGSGITGFNDLDVAGIAGAVWNALTASYGSANTYGALIETNLDAAISTRGTSTLTAANVWDTNISAYSGAGYAGTYLKGVYDKLPAGTIGTGTSTLTAQQVWEYATRALTDKSGFALTQAFPSNFSSLVISALGKVTVGTNDDKTGYTASTVSDKTGYALTQAFPANFSSLAITAGGAVTAGTVSDKTGYSISGTKTTLDALNDITAASIWGVATRTLTAGSYSGLTEADIDAIWNELQSGHTTAGSFGKYLDAQVSSVGGGSLTLADIADAVLDELLSGHTVSGSLGKTISNINDATDGDKEGAVYTGIENTIRQQR